MDNVTPIRADVRIAKRKARKPRTLTLRAGEEGEVRTLDVISGLQAVCVALDESAAYKANADHTHNLVMAARVLSTILMERLPQ